VADGTFVPLDKPRKRIVDRKRVEAARLRSSSQSQVSRSSTPAASATT
jgi:hypothetical protein